jgi:colicin import membrane protein
VEAYYPRIPEEKNSVAALILSALVHVFFIGALFLSVQWKRQTGGTVSVELWGSGFPGGGDGVSEGGSGGNGVRGEAGKSGASAASFGETGGDAPSSAPPAPPTLSIPRIPVSSSVETLPPARVDITYRESDTDKKKDKKRSASERTTPLAAPRRDFSRELKRELRETRRASQEEELRSMLENTVSGQKGSAGTGCGRGLGGGGGGGIGSGTGSGTGGGGWGVAGYQDKIRMKIRGNILLPAGIPGNPEAVFRVTQLPSGEILKVELIKSSAYAPLDEAVERAILKSSPLPKPDNPAHFERELRIPYRPYS